MARAERLALPAAGLMMRNQRSKAHCLGTPGPRFSAAWAVAYDRGADLWARGKRSRAPPCEDRVKRRVAHAAPALRRRPFTMV
jgi:hypothetical protein